MKIIISLFVLTVLLSCSNNNLSDKEISDYTIKGKEIGQATLKELGGNLMKQMKEGGTKQAIPFCNVSANPLTETLSKKYNVSIKRTSHKLRNEKNKPTKAESKILEGYLASLSKNEKLKPIVSKDDTGKVHFYAPIKMQTKCLACHGTISKEINKTSDSIIKSLYPKDKAIGFKENDLRGILSVTFN
jgi:hypothetical protein